jgi:hypothetical protein
MMQPANACLPAHRVRLIVYTNRCPLSHETMPLTRATDYTYLRICCSADFSSRDTCACEMPISSATSICVRP